MPNEDNIKSSKMLEEVIKINNLESESLKKYEEYILNAPPVKGILQ